MWSWTDSLVGQRYVSCVCRPELSRPSAWRVSCPFGRRGRGSRAGRARWPERSPGSAVPGSGRFRQVGSPLSLTVSSSLRVWRPEVVQEGICPRLGRPDLMCFEGGLKNAGVSCPYLRLFYGFNCWSRETPSWSVTSKVSRSQSAMWFCGQ